MPVQEGYAALHLPGPAPSWWRRGITLLSVALVGGLGAVGIWWVATSQDRSGEGATGAAGGTDTVLRETDPADRPDEPRAQASATTVRSHRHVNDAGAYSFLYPARWRLESNGEMSKAWSPDGDLVMSFALGPDRLASSYRNFIRLLAASYDAVLVQDVKSSRVSGREAISVRGRGRDASGRSIAFRALLVERDDARSVGAFAVTVGRRFDGRLNEILSSLRV